MDMDKNILILIINIFYIFRKEYKIYLLMYDNNKKIYYSDDFIGMIDNTNDIINYSYYFSIVFVFKGNDINKVVSLNSMELKYLSRSDNRFSGYKYCVKVSDIYSCNICVLSSNEVLEDEELIFNNNENENLVIYEGNGNENVTNESNSAIGNKYVYDPENYNYYYEYDIISSVDQYNSIEDKENISCVKKNENYVKPTGNRDNNNYYSGNNYINNNDGSMIEIMDEYNNLSDEDKIKYKSIKCNKFCNDLYKQICIRGRVVYWIGLYVDYGGNTLGPKGVFNGDFVYRGNINNVFREIKNKELVVHGNMDFMMDGGDTSGSGSSGCDDWYNNFYGNYYRMVGESVNIDGIDLPEKRKYWLYTDDGNGNKKEYVWSYEGILVYKDRHQKWELVIGGNRRYLFDKMKQKNMDNIEFYVLNSQSEHYMYRYYNLFYVAYSPFEDEIGFYEYKFDYTSSDIKRVVIELLNMILVKCNIKILYK